MEEQFIFDDLHLNDIEIKYGEDPDIKIPYIWIINCIFTLN